MSETTEKDENAKRVRDLYRDIYHGNRTHFAIRVTDDSLRGAGIPKGAGIRFRRSVTFRDGDLIAALTPDGLFVAFAYYVEGGRVRLEGRHPRCPVRTYLRRDVKVLGVGHPVANESELEPVAEGDGLEWPEYIGDAA